MDGTGNTQQPAPQQPPLTNQQKTDWNSFLDFVDKEGFKGNPILDDKSKQLGQYLMQKFQSKNPKTSITYQDVPRVQKELQDYRNDVIGEWKSGKAQMDGVKTEDDVMPGLSPVDGWLGSKTSSHKFPVATGTKTVNGQTTTTNYGVDTKKFDADYLKKGK